uniref:USG-1 protein homolog n=1 Tax=Azotobacter vinelandii TaxID=354 RepID=USG_AZOVI|nr:RecName: Full=USG-1 protein homolog [Azotobacter vinelandii]CAA72153.1 Usg1 protein [Azotobacter vinelandii]
MSPAIDIAIVGATGTVGAAIVEILEERDFPVGQLHLLASPASAGKSVSFKGRNLRVKSIEAFDFAQVRLVFFAAGQAVTRQYASQARAAGCMLVDLSGALPLQQAPRVVAEVNPQVLEKLEAPCQVTSPASQVVALALALAPLRPLVRWRHLGVTACLPVSSLGREGVAELARQTTELLNGRPPKPRFFDRQIAFNLLGRVGDSDTAGHTGLERRLVEESRQVLDAPELKISVTCLMAPVFFGDSLSLAVQASQAIDPSAVRAALERAPGLELIEPDDCPTVIGDAVGQDVAYVGRVRTGVDDACELDLWIASDNVRKGSALNAVQLAELLIKQGR